MNWIKLVVDVPHELVGRPFIFPVLVHDTEVLNQMAVKGCILPIDQNIMAVDSYGPMIVRDREGKDLLIKLVLT